MYSQHRSWVVGLLVGTAVAVSGCGGGQDSAEAPPRAGVAVDLRVAGILVQTNAAPPPAQSVPVIGVAFSVNQIYSGVMRAVDRSTGAETRVPWSAYVDDVTLGAQSNNMANLAPGRYDISLLLSRGTQTYAGSATDIQVQDGQISVPITLRPVIGNSLAGVELVARVADFRFSYDPAELRVAGIASPQIGIVVDGNPEQIFRLNAAIGVSEHMFLNLEPGPHSIRLRLYDGQVQRGKSVPAQENVTVVPGVDVPMDLISLHGDIAAHVTGNTGAASFHLTVPGEVVAEAGGTDNLTALFSVVAPGMPAREARLDLADPDGDGNFGATASWPDGFRFGTATMSVAFSETSSGEPLGTCVVAEVVLSSLDTAQTCPLVLRRRAVIGGRLLAVVGVNVMDSLDQPVPGAIVTANGDVVGITGSGETPGYVKAFLPAGSYTLRAEREGLVGETPALLAPLAVSNVQLTFGSFVSDSDNDGVLDTADLCLGTPAGETVNRQGCAASQLTPALNDGVLSGAYGPVSFLITGNAGRVGGVTWSISNLDYSVSDKLVLYSVLMDDPAEAPYGISMDGLTISGTEIVSVSMAPPTNPAAGVVAFTGQTQIPNAQGGGAQALSTRIVVTVTQADGVTPIALRGVSDFGITPRLGFGGFEVPNVGGLGAYRVNMKGEVSADGGATWRPYLDFFDSYPTFPTLVTGYSFGASFYDK